MDLIGSLKRLARFEEAEEVQERIAPYVDLEDPTDSPGARDH
jgi:hypothetical protein